MEMFTMSTEDLNASPAPVEATEPKGAPKTQPAPPMLWMLLPVALLALLAYLSR